VSTNSSRVYTRIAGWGETNLRAPHPVGSTDGGRAGKIDGVKVGTPLGEYPFQFRRVERRGREVVVVGLVAGMESSVVVGPEDLRSGLRRVGPALAVAALVLALRRRAR